MPLGDWKAAWDFVHFPGTKMSLQFISYGRRAPLPAHPLFASPERSGEHYPNAEAALESTLIIGSQS